MNFFVADGVRLAYRVDGSGAGPTIVMVNSLGTDLRMWDPQVALLSRSFRVVRFDCRGHGASEVPTGPYTIERFGHDLLALLDTLQIERAHICGLSLGGMVALWFAARYPERIMSAVFANTAAQIGTAELWSARMHAVSEGGMSAIRDAVLARFLSEEFRRRHPAVVRQIGGMIEATNPNGYMGACAVLRDTDLRERLAAIHVPALILASTLDESTPLSQARELHSAIAGSTLEVLSEAAHLSNVEQPEKFSQYLLAFLKRP
jgi:3-oxoadipate enol-lactonase